MSLPPALQQASPVSFPRVSGDEPVNEESTFDLELFSPRERG